MSRIQTSNYGADLTTQFQWATTDDDQFDREFDIYRLSQALEFHDHSATRGLPVARLAAGIVDATALAPLSVSTGVLQDLSVTNAKLAAGAVTRDKITFPLVQPTNDMAGGFRMRETANTYALGFYMAANGLAVFGSGTTAGTVPANLILGQAGQVTVGTAQGGALFNVMQATNVVGGGLRVYNTNNGFYGDFYNNTSGWPVFAANGNISFLMEPAVRGAVSIGTSVAAGGKLNIYQPTGAPGAVASEGFYMNWAGNPGVYKVFIDANNDVNLQSATTSVRLAHGSNSLVPLTNNATDLGGAGLRWGTGFFTTLNVSGVSTLTGGATISGTTTVAGLTVTGGIIGLTGLAVGGALTTVTAITASGTATLGSVVSNFFQPVTDGGGNLGTTSVRFSRLFLTDAVGVGMAVNPSYQIQLSVDLAGKPGTNTWSVVSDIRTKIENTIHDYEAGLDQVLALRPRHYKTTGEFGTLPMTNEDEYLIGLVAQEAQDISPELVRAIPTPRSADNQRKSNILTVNTHALPFMLINAVKTLHERIAALETQLKNRRN